MIKAIVSVTQDWGIGYKGELLVPNKADMQHFVRMTTGASVITGSTTFETFPKGPLKNRRNIVLAQTHSYEREGFPKATCTEQGKSVQNYEVYTSTQEALSHIKPDEDVWIIGGAYTYQQFLPYCTEIVVTKSDCVCQADTYFPNLDKMDDWRITSTTEGGVTSEGVHFSFVTYQHV